MLLQPHRAGRIAQHPGAGPHLATLHLAVPPPKSPASASIACLERANQHSTGGCSLLHCSQIFWTARGRPGALLPMTSIRLAHALPGG